MTKILKMWFVNILSGLMNSNELLCEAGLEHDFNCLIVKCIFGKGALSDTTRRRCGFLRE